MSPKDYPVIDTTLKFCDIYLHTGSQLYELRMDNERDRAVLQWLLELRHIAQAAKTDVLVQEFRRGGGTPRPINQDLLRD